MLKQKENSQKIHDEVDSSFVITEASSLCDDLIESAPDELHTHKEESSRGGRAKTLLRGAKKKRADTMGVRRSSRLNKKI
jgi:hypothetical protein